MFSLSLVAPRTWKIYMVVESLVWSLDAPSPGICSLVFKVSAHGNINMLRITLRPRLAKNLCNNAFLIVVCKTGTQQKLVFLFDITGFLKKFVIQVS